jgi:hypothetical protein
MRALFLPAACVVAAALSLYSPSATAKGCLKGAVVGGVAGHYAGHHGLLGAGAGCVIGHHEANKHARERQQTSPQGYGSSSPSNDSR